MKIKSLGFFRCRPVFVVRSFPFPIGCGTTRTPSTTVSAAFLACHVFPEMPEESFFDAKPQSPRSRDVHGRQFRLAGPLRLCAPLRLRVKKTPIRDARTCILVDFDRTRTPEPQHFGAQIWRIWADFADKRSDPRYPPTSATSANQVLGPDSRDVRTHARRPYLTKGWPRGQVTRSGD